MFGIAQEKLITDLPNLLILADIPKTIDGIK
jgi:hypothetical protein